MTFQSDANQKQPPKRRVIKLGGSLLNVSNVVDHLNSLIASLPQMENFIVVGGGQAANLIREWDSNFGLGHRRSHRMAIFAMTWNAKRLFENRSDHVFIRHFETWPGVECMGVVLSEPFLLSATEFGRHTALPESWDVTSDSIAAFVAHALGAEQLMMLKSVDSALTHQQSQMLTLPSCNGDLVDVSGLTALNRLAERKLVDSEFPGYASAVPVVSWCNFRRLIQPSTPKMR